ncbi:hypothetical protein [Algoriphagus sp. A40]|uniref:hypothetical protein n=1 Tax=Algoriphagus sp. A40 TaxID=1945863 RepID=UPI00098519FB|nr:hypothetical protein [Algoriphagus sp. A40]OOG72357.1 hypothetical protein B0E43_15800 [Algoriphagus sp. A40]
MSPIDSDKKQWPDPKDYGLPYVEITPIRTKTELGKSESKKTLSEPEKIGETREKNSAPALSQTKIEQVQEVKTPEEKAQSPKSSPSVNKPLEEKKSGAWVWAVVLIGLGIVSVIVWQIQSRKDSSPAEVVTESIAKPAEETEPEAAVQLPDSTTTEQIQNPVNQDSITSPNISNPNISKPAETGTTIANTATGKLIRVEAKAERPQYFIIVGSLPNEKMATEEANQYFGKSPEIYLITPYDGGKYYRLGLLKFDSFKLAAAKLEEIKSQYTEELWILKY